MKKWVAEDRSLTNKRDNPKTDYKAKELKEFIITKKIIDKNIEVKLYDLIDARSEKRFLGKVNEPREGLKAGKYKAFN